MIKSGFILINKPIKLSSQRVDSIIKKKYNLNKVGHLGTLDPLAEGLLVVAINDATKYFKYFENLSKKYILRLRLGATSKTLDNEGEITEAVDTNLMEKESYIDEILANFPRKYLQTPPIYSAIKVGGTPLYKYALKNEDVEIKKRPVEIYSLKRLSNIEYIDGSSYLDIELFVSKGFYVRSFAKELGDVLSIPAMAEEIKRVEVGKFNIDDSVSLDDEIKILDPTTYLDFKEIEIDDKLYKIIINGSKLDPKILNTKDDYVILKHKSLKIAIYKFEKDENIYRMDLLIKNENIIPN